MCYTIKMTYKEFTWLKNNNYSYECLKIIACRYLNCKVEDIDDIDFNFKLRFNVYLKEDFGIVQESVDKETPLMVNYISDGYADGYPVHDTATCPNCTRIFEVYDEEHYNYCPNCGQHLNWDTEDEDE